MNHWFRLYNTLVDDPKVQQLPEALFKALINLWCVASQNDGVLPSAGDIGYKLRVKPERAAEMVTRLVQAGLIDNVDGVFIPHNWDSRQFQSDNSTDRVKKHRDKKKGNVSGNVSGNTKRNVPETPNGTDRAEQSKSDTEQSRADASAPIDEDLKKREAGLRAGIGAHFASRGHAVPANMDRCLLWLTQGYAAGTVLGAIETVLKRGKPISTLDYFDGAIKDAHAKAPPAILIDTMADWFLIIQGTTEEICWQQYSRETTGRPMFICDQIHNGNTVQGAKKPTLFPPGYDEATGERVAPSAEENAA